MKPKVLFVDDDADLLAGIQMGLSHQPYDVLTATSAEEGLRLLSAHDIAFVVSDDRMPGMRGVDFLTEVARLHPNTMTMLLTGYGDLETAMRAINEGHVYRFMLKPCRVPELRQVVNDALQIRRLVDASTQLVLQTRKERASLDALERQHPGITQVDRTEDGAVIIDGPGEKVGLEKLAPAPRGIAELIREIELLVDTSRKTRRGEAA